MGFVQMRAVPRALVFAVVLALGFVAAPAHAARNYIAGQIVDRNGNPVERAIITLKPGNVQLITDGEGRFLIDYARADDGTRIRLARKIDYELEVFKPGFHIEERKFFYKRGAITIDPITLAEDTLVVDDDGQNLDPGLFGDRTQTSGATYEGQ